MYKVTMKGKTILSILNMNFREVINFVERAVPRDFKKLFPYLLLGEVSFIFYDSKDSQEKHVFIIKEKEKNFKKCIDF